MEDWASYAERMDFYLAANEITNAGEDISSSPEYVWAVNLQTHSLLSFPDPIPDGPIEQEDHHRELPRCSQRIRPDDPWTDMLHNYRGKCEEQLIIVLIVLQHSSLFCVL